MFYLILGGGLGNQMFQYAYARMLQEKYKIQIEYNDWHYHYETTRNFALNNLSVNKDIKMCEEKKKKNIYEKTKKIQKIIHTIVPVKIMKSDVFFRILNSGGLYYTPETYRYIETRPIKKESGVIIGAFQSWKYFDEYRDIIKPELMVLTKPSKENSNLIHEIKNCNSVCVHVRRGDYIGTQWSKTLEICDYKYYLDAMKVIANRVNNPVFYIFSNSNDDINWIKRNYKFDYTVKYIELNNPDFEELRLMYSCKHFIISNSTFSWWAQYLAENKNKMVIAPNVWSRRKDIEWKDIYMPNWIHIQCGM